MTDPRRPVARLLNRDFVLLWQGQLVSQLGHQAFVLGMMYWTMEATGSARLMGLLMMLALLPGVVLAPLGGALADRHSRLALILVSDVVRGVAVLALAGAMLAWPREEALVAAVAAVAFLGGVVNAVFQPAISAAISDLVPAERVAAANSLHSSSVQASVLVGQAGGGLAYAALGAPVLFLIDGLTYLFSAASESFIRMPRARPRTGTDAGFAAYWREAMEGVRYVRSRRGMGSLLGVAAAVNFFAMPVILLLPFYVTGSLGQGPEGYGFLLAALGAGALAGYAAAAALPIAPRRWPAVFAAAVGVTGLSFVAAGQVRELVLALALFFAVGTLTGLTNVMVLTLFQVSTPTEMRGRVMALVIALSGAAAPLGMLLGGVVGDATGKDVPLVYGACGAAITLLALVAGASAAVRELLATEAPPTSGSR